MKTYTATGMRIDTGGGVVHTGHDETYLAESLEDAAKACLYTHQLHNADAYLGASGMVVRCPTCGALVIFVEEAS